MADNQSTADGVYMSIGRISRILGISRETLRDYEKQGKIKAFRTCGGSAYGQRRYLLDEVKRQVLGVEADSVKKEKIICVYCRVSSASQKDSLARQLERVLSHVEEHENISRDKITVFSEIGSAFSNRPIFNRLLEEIISGRISKVICEVKDRAARIPGVYSILSHFAEKHNVELSFISQNDVEEGSDTFFVQEIIDFITVVCNRNSSKKQALRREEHLEPEAIEFIRKEIATGRSIHASVKKADLAGFRTKKGNKLSYHIVQKNLRKLENIPLPVEGEHSFKEFWKHHIRKKATSKVQVAAIHSAYKLYCEKKEIDPISKRRCGEWLRENKMAYEVRSGYIWYSNLEILGYPSVVITTGSWARKYDNGIRLNHTSKKSK